MTLSIEERPVINSLPADPLGMHNSALVIKDEDGNSVTDLDEWTNSISSDSTNYGPPAAINVENSSDVIIGPVTQFNGPVTIYQNVNGTQHTPSITQNGSTNDCLNGKLVKSESTSSDAPPPTEKEKKLLIHSRHVKYIGISLLVLIIIAIIATATILSLKSDSHDLPTPSKAPDNRGTTSGGSTSDGPKPAGPGIIITKQEWGGRDALPWNTSLQLHHPVQFVIIAHTVTPQCLDFDACSRRVQSIQSYHVTTGKSPDIGYNFIIGGDGNAYIGRGWDTRNFTKDNSILIALIGNYVFDHLTPGMIDILQKLINEGVKKGIIAENYKLIGHKQVFATESPGNHVMDEIKKWPHYDPARYV